tara:strand:- start:221 stop:517 length:297 start_codon:yes stop_codon:yes gene_type:complete
MESSELIWEPHFEAVGCRVKITAVKGHCSAEKLGVSPIYVRKPYFWEKWFKRTLEGKVSKKLPKVTTFCRKQNNKETAEISITATLEVEHFLKNLRKP